MTRTNEPLHVVVGLGHDDSTDVETLLESYRLTSRFPSCVLHLVHVITPDESEQMDADSTLERLDMGLVQERDRIDDLVRRTLGAYPASLEMHVDVEIARHRHRALEQAARRHAATLLIVHAHDGEESETLPSTLIAHAPCSVLVVRPRSTPTHAEPLLEPAPEPGEPIRTQNAVSRTHVLVPSEPRDRKRHLDDPMGAL
ncbi:MAG: universal stress protein [Sandaracinus sp.]|nr:universal stress protein [Sandaracinus sp.]MCB9619368.1 universal stress protein [Sandaracinus sp.]MCB9621926.1 universal stress protein [Sandaracinus sp.]MCB9636640.1 universal stress protein [Sandaracinus sp.]